MKIAKSAKTLNLRAVISGVVSKEILQSVVLALVYFFSGKFGLTLAFAHPSATPVWPPTGIAVASLLIWGRRLWPGVLLGAFFVNVTTTGDILSSLGISFGNTLEALIAVYLIRKFIQTINPFLKPGHILLYIFLAGGVAPIVSATIGVTSLFFTGNLNTNLFQVWTTWFLGDMGGALVVAPPIVLWKYYHKLYTSITRSIEIIVLLITLTLPPILVFGGLLPITVTEFPIAFLPIPILVWIAYRFGPRETSSAILFLSFVAIFGTLSGFGPFVLADANQSLLIVQIFMVITFLAVMPLSSAIYEERKTQKHLQALIDASPDPVVELDLKGNIIFANEQAIKMYGFNKVSEMIGKNGFDFVAPEDRKRTQKILGDIISKGGAYENIEYISVRHDGSRFVSSSSGSLIRDNNGAPQSVIGVVHNITKAKELDRAKTDFVSVASHQLRTPLSSMRWNLEMLLKKKYGDLPVKIEEVLIDIQASNLRLIKLVNQLLEITRLDQGKSVNRAKFTNIVSTVSGLIADFQKEAEMRSVGLEFHPQKPKIDVLIDELKFIQVVQNLIENAIIYNKKGGSVDVTINESNGKVVISVKDTGIGVKAEDKDKIFTKFYRTRESTQKNADSTGLGLYLVKSFVENWRGKIDLESEYLKGSTFKVTLPTQTDSGS